MQQRFPNQLFTRFYDQHGQRLCRSYQQLLNEPLLTARGSSLIESLFEAPFAILSHGVEDDPIFNFGNRKALELFEYSWGDFIQLPSRLSAQPMVQAQRQQLLDTVSEQGYISDYSGVRIAASGRLFTIKHAVVWNIVDENGRYCGQAARI